MIPAFIIDQIRQREERERSRDEQPRMELPLPMLPIPIGPETDEEGRGVMILELRSF